ncbi:MAG: hypothetical protein RMJ14_04770 [Nitrososphaerota archaeon]|nr:hypothetical protein [Nitrososphaerota archaeon]
MAEYIMGMRYEDLVEEVRKRKLLPEPVESWLKEYEPLFRNLRKEGVEVYTFCYKDDKSFELETKTAIETALLVLRDSIVGKVSTDKWLKLLTSQSQIADATRREAEYILEESSNYKKNICIAGFEGRDLKKHLEQETETWVKYIGLPHHFTPLEVLKREVRLGKVSEERVRQLVGEHIKFIREMVIPKDLETAIYEWTKRMLYWHPKVFNKGKEKEGMF